MRRFGLVGMALVLCASSATAQQVVNVTTTHDCKTKTTVIEKAPPVPTLDQLGHMQAPCAPKAPQCCLLLDQPALLYRLSVMNALQMNAGIGVGLAPRVDDLHRPAVLEDKKPVVEDKKIDEKATLERPFPATMTTLKTATWGECGRRWADDCDRNWCLIKGCPLPEKMPLMRGWLLESDGKKTYFLHETGNLYTRMTPPAP